MPLMDAAFAVTSQEYFYGASILAGFIVLLLIGSLILPEPRPVLADSSQRHSSNGLKIFILTLVLAALGNALGWISLAALPNTLSRYSCRPMGLRLRSRSSCSCVAGGWRGPSTLGEAAGSPASWAICFWNGAEPEFCRCRSQSVQLPSLADRAGIDQPIVRRYSG